MVRPAAHPTVLATAAGVLLAGVVSFAAAIVAVFDTPVAVGATRRVSVNACAPAATVRLARVHRYVPLVVQVQPDGCVSATNDVPAGNGSDTATSVATAGPKFRALRLYTAFA